MHSPDEIRRYTMIDSPIGELLLTSNGTAITGLHMEGSEPPSRPGTARQQEDQLLAAARHQVAAYFAGELTAFDLPLALEGTPFQQQVWAALRAIPYGETISYGELARRIGNIKAVRAVGTANGRNPLAVIVPCHRVIGADGSLTGFGGGIGRKKILLAHEARVCARGPLPDTRADARVESSMPVMLRPC